MNLIEFTEKCISCRACVEVCPGGVIGYDPTQDNPKPKPYVKFPNICIDCGHCVAVCPADACIHKHLPLSEFKPLIKDSPMNFEDFERLVSKRRSIRAYKKISVPDEDIKKIIDNVCRYSPTGGNSQTLSYLIIKDEDVKVVSDFMDVLFRKVYKLLKSLFFLNFLKVVKENRAKLGQMIQFYAEGRDIYSRGAPVIVLVLTNKGYATSFEDGVIAATNFVLAAETMGLGTCFYGFLKIASKYSKTLRNLLKIPNNKSMAYAVLLGYPKYTYKKSVFRKPIEIIGLNNMK